MPIIVGRTTARLHSMQGAAYNTSGCSNRGHWINAGPKHGPHSRHLCADNYGWLIGSWMHTVDSSVALLMVPTSGSDGSTPCIWLHARHA